MSQFLLFSRVASFVWQFMVLAISAKVFNKMGIGAKTAMI